MSRFKMFNMPNGRSVLIDGDKVTSVVEKSDYSLVTLQCGTKHKVLMCMTCVVGLIDPTYKSRHPFCGCQRHDIGVPITPEGELIV